LPVATVESLFKLKLSSDREKDLFDLVTLARDAYLPAISALGRLTPQQRDNYEYVNLLLSHAPETVRALGEATRVLKNRR